jgi:hypothetical protein
MVSRGVWIALTVAVIGLLLVNNLKLEPANQYIAGVAALALISYWIDSLATKKPIDSGRIHKLQLIRQLATFDPEKPDSVEWTRYYLPPYQQVRIETNWYNVENEWFAVIRDKHQNPVTIAVDASKNSLNPEARIFKMETGNNLTLEWAKKASLARKKTELEQLLDLKDDGIDPEQALEYKERLTKIKENKK